MLSWEEGRREEWAGSKYPANKKAAHLKSIEATLATQPTPHPGRPGHYNTDSWWNAVRLDDDMLLEMWNRFPREVWRSNTAMLLIARLGEKILPDFIDYAVMLRQPTTSKVLFPVVSTRVAEIMADALPGARSRDDAEAWLNAHPDIAAVGIIPVALGSSKARDNAGAALRFLVSKGHGDMVRKVAAEYGQAAELGVARVLESEAMGTYPDKLPKLPEFFASTTLPRILLKNKSALSAKAIEHLGTMLAWSTPETPVTGIDQVKEACDSASLEEFAWGLFEAWLAAGAPPKEKWAFLALGVLGGDTVARRLTPLVRTWPGEAQARTCGLGARRARGDRHRRRAHEPARHRPEAEVQGGCRTKPRQRSPRSPRRAG
jgi:hypothetical protein